MKIVRDEKIEFKSWQQVKSECQRKNVHGPDVSCAELLNDIDILESKAHDSFFHHIDFPEINSLINQFKYYRVDNELPYAFVDDVHLLANQIKELELLPGSNKLFKLGIFTNFGVFSQFKVTLWLSKFFPVLGMEEKNNKIDIDLSISVSETKIGIQVKDVREESRRSRQEDAITVIDIVLANRAREKGSDRRLSLLTFEGVPPSGLNEYFWENVAKNLEEKEQVKKIIILPGDGGRNLLPVEITLEFGFKEFSGIFNHAAKGFENSQKLQQSFDELNLKLSKNPQQAFFLIAITEDEYDWNELNLGIENDACGLMVVDIFDNEISRSPLIMPKNFKKIQENFNSGVPPVYKI